MPKDINSIVNFVQNASPNFRGLKGVKPISNGVQLQFYDGTLLNFFPTTGTCFWQGNAEAVASLNPVSKQATENTLKNFAISPPQPIVGPAPQTQSLSPQAPHHPATTAQTQPAPAQPQPEYPPPAPTSTNATASASTAVFVVYGHDSVARDRLELLLHRSGVTPVVLHNQRNQGETIIEKFERCSANVKFAIVLLTPDDVGGVAGSSLNDLKPRARQNVVLELGYFYAKLGRRNVAVLKNGSVEIPSDILGIMYITFTHAVDDAWPDLEKEMRNAHIL